MDENTLIAYALSLPEVSEDYPFGPQAQVFKVAGKMFALIGHTEWKGQENVAQVNLKCDPQEALMLRDVFEAVIPGYHMNKVHWNSVLLDGSIPAAEIERMVDKSYGLVVKGLKKAERRAMEIRWGEQRLYK
ncbi:Predicted DNA-binding protein, MmcQ/YjbR family [Alteromonadaceae bacterium Bs31]|nr:Predicted DNA-binding protein, MmcQ/YjbR family [Alteromonadaceae bacterium Bs31]